MTIDSEQIGRLRQLEFFRGVPDDLLPWLAADAEMRTFDRAASVFAQGDPVTHFYIVMSGWVKIYRLRPDGTETVIEVFGPGESFAEGAMFLEGGYPAGAEMVEDGRLLGVPVASYIAKLQERPELAMRMLAGLAVHLKRFVNRIETIHSQTASQRLGAFLLKFCAAPSDGEASCVRLPYDKRLIANRLGMQPETFSRALARLRKHGAVVNGREACIVDRDALLRHVSRSER